MDKANRIEIFKSMMLCLDDPKSRKSSKSGGSSMHLHLRNIMATTKAVFSTILSQLPRLLLTSPRRTVSFGSSNAHRGLSVCFTTSAKSTNTVIPLREELLTEISIAPSTMSRVGEYNTETLLKGHGDKSVMRCASLLQLTEEEVMCIRYHMGAFTDKEEWQDYESDSSLSECPVDSSSRHDCGSYKGALI